MIKQDPPPWRIWVDTQRRIVSFHPEDGFELLEFRDQALFFRCVDEYTRQQYRYQCIFVKNLGSHVDKLAVFAYTLLHKYYDILCFI